jgi:hypothetical protein
VLIAVQSGAVGSFVTKLYIGLAGTLTPQSSSAGLSGDTNKADIVAIGARASGTGGATLDLGMSGAIGIVQVYTGAMTSGDAATLYQYLKNYYGTL